MVLVKKKHMILYITFAIVFIWILTLNEKLKKIEKFYESKKLAVKSLNDINALNLTDIFIVIKSSSTNYNSRIRNIIDTWYSFAENQVGFNLS